MSVVYLAEQLRLARKVALKILSPDLAEDERFRDRFVRESRLAASLEHPNIIPIYEAGEAEGVLFIAMRRVRGTDLKTLIAQDAALSPPRTLHLMGQAADALDAAHAEGLIHRDVKPGNILVAPPAPGTSGEHVYLSDFGLTKRVSSESGITGTGQFIGTLDYAAPEQFEGNPLDARTDVYSLGCVLFECLTGRVPFEREQDAALMYAHLLSPPPKASELRPQLPSEIDGIIARAMAKDPAERFDSAGELLAAARTAVGSLPQPHPSPRPATSPAGSAEAPSRPTPRKRPQLVAAVIALALLAAGALVLGPLSRDATGPVTPTSPAPSRSAEPGPANVAGPALVRIDPATNETVGEPISLTDAGAVAAGSGTVWVAQPQEGRLANVDSASGSIMSVPVGQDPRAVVVGSGEIQGVWVATSDQLWGVDAVTNEITATIQLPERPSGLAIGGGKVWVSTTIVVNTDIGLFPVDPVARTVGEGISVGLPRFAIAAPIGVVFESGSVWVLDPNPPGGDGLVVSVDARSLAQEVIGLEQGSPVAIGAGDGRVWVLYTNGALRAIDPAASTLGPPIGTSRGASALAVGEGGVWVLNGAAGTLTRVDPVTGSIVATIDVPKGSKAVAAGEGGVWVTSS